MVNIFYKYNTTKLVKIDEVLAENVYHAISQSEAIPIGELYLSIDGRSLRNDKDIYDNCTVEMSLRLMGGKGGFGNMLKKKAKVTNPNATLDFSYCRDLNGRRMLYVNAEVAIKKWKERLEKLEEMKAHDPNATIADVPTDAPKAGIHGWYSEVPSWAEGIKRSRNSFVRQQKKQKMCDRWWNARKNGNIPVNASHHWGCPRRDQCDYAHGLDELSGEGRHEFVQEEENKKKQAEKDAIDTYVQYKSMADDAMSAVEMGMQMKRKGKKTEKRSLLPFDDDNFGFQNQPKKWNVEKRSVLSSSVGIASVSGEAFASRLSVMSGMALIEDDGVIIASSSFPTVRLGGIILVTGRIYYEVHVLSEGLVQIGWCGVNNSCNEDEENGVGDDEASWGYDVIRAKKWNGENSGEFGEVCISGDIVGVLMDVDQHTLQFTKNGADLGVAFSNVVSIGGVFPAISLEKEEAVLVNLGQFQFEFEPMEEATSVWEYVKKVRV